MSARGPTSVLTPPRRCVFRWLAAFSLALWWHAPARGESDDVEPTVLTTGRLSAYNDGPGGLRAEVTSRLARSPVLLATGAAVVFKIDWHYADATPVRTLSATLRATAKVYAEVGGVATEKRDARELKAAAPPKAVGRHADAMELELQLPATQTLALGVIRLRAQASSSRTTHDTGWHSYPVVIVRRDRLSDSVPPTLAKAAAVVYGHLAACSAATWDGAARSAWFAADTASVVRGCCPDLPPSTLRERSEGALLPRAWASQARASLLRLLSARAGRAPAETRNLLEEALRGLAEARERLSGSGGPRVAAELLAVQEALESLRDALPVETAKADSVEPRTPAEVPPAQPRPVQDAPARPLLNGDFSAGIDHWSLRGGGDDLAAATAGPSELAGGAPALHLRRTGNRLTLGSVGAVQEVSLPVGNDAPLELSAKVRVGDHKPTGGGSLGSIFPLRLVVRYLDAAGGEQAYAMAFYAQGRAVAPPASTRVVLGAWHDFHSGPLRALAPKPARITSVEVWAAGRTFDSMVREIALSPAESVGTPAGAR